MILSTMRVSVRPDRFGDSVLGVASRRVATKPFEGQPRKFKRTIRLPNAEIKESTIKNAGMGLFVAEDVNEGEPVTLFARNVIPEWLAEIRKKKVRAYRTSQSLSLLILLSCLNLSFCRAIYIFVTITKPAAAWTQNQPLCTGMRITVTYIRLLDSPTQL